MYNLKVRIGGMNMPNLIDMMDKNTLEAFKEELANSSSKEEVLARFLNEWQSIDEPIEKQTETVIYNVSFGLNRTQATFQKDIDNMVPYSKVQNFEGIKDAQGEWKNIYNIAYPTGEATTISVEIDTPSHQKVFDKAA